MKKTFAIDKEGRMFLAKREIPGVMYEVLDPPLYIANWFVGVDKSKGF